MNPRIETLKEKKLVGMKIQTSVSNFGAPQLWQTLMPRQREIEHRIEGVYYSIQIYSIGFEMKNFSPTTLFQYWAAIEINKPSELPDGMESFTLSEGKYAVFTHKGLVSEFRKTLEIIHSEWIPNSSFEVDDRPHFELLGEKYLGPNNPNSEEEVWVPIK